MFKITLREQTGDREEKGWKREPNTSHKPSEPVPVTYFPQQGSTAFPNNATKWDLLFK